MYTTIVLWVFNPVPCTLSCIMHNSEDSVEKITFDFFRAGACMQRSFHGFLFTESSVSVSCKISHQPLS